MDILKNYAGDVRPWGHFERFTLNEPTTVKVITVRAGEATSLQTHAHRDEFWRVVSGSGSVIVGNALHAAQPGDDFFVQRGTPHRLQGGQHEDLCVLEISLGEFNENDIIRIEDNYGRA